ncbi:MAG TPA: hypothetical protein PLD73_12835, partial [Candidatus Hydrogenedentes bacterium]|nr:hypothetical protein [Candidatus Hydrogenedentota bacterium]
KASKEMAKLNYELTQQGIEANLDRYPRISEIGRAQTKTQVVELNDLLKSEYEASLDEYYPEWRTDILGALGDAQADERLLPHKQRAAVIALGMHHRDKVTRSADQMADIKAVRVQEGLVGVMRQGKIAPEKQYAGGVAIAQRDADRIGEHASSFGG